MFENMLFKFKHIVNRITDVIKQGKEYFAKSVASFFSDKIFSLCVLEVFCTEGVTGFLFILVVMSETFAPQYWQNSLSLGNICPQLVHFIIAVLCLPCK